MRRHRETCRHQGTPDQGTLGQGARSFFHCSCLRLWIAPLGYTPPSGNAPLPGNTRLGNARLLPQWLLAPQLPTPLSGQDPGNALLWIALLGYAPSPRYALLPPGHAPPLGRTPSSRVAGQGPGSAARPLPPLHLGQGPRNVVLCLQLSAG